MSWQQYTYGQLLQALRKDLQLDATTDILPGTIAAAVGNDTTTHKLVWTAAPLINSWANAGGAFETAAYLKDPLGFVHLKGVIQTGTSGTVAFILPAGYRPGATTFHPSINGGLTGAGVQIAANGNVTAFSAGLPASAFGLSGMTFLAEN